MGGGCICSSAIKLYLLKCSVTVDRWIVPFHAPTLLAWDAHCNFQYVTSKGFARYMTKYISKAKPSHIFNVSEGNHYYHHVYLVED